MVSKAYRGRMPLPRLTMRNGSFGSLRPAPGHCRLLPIAREGILRAEVSPHEQEAEIQKLMARPFKGRPAN